MKATFKNNYTWKSGGKCPEGMIGCAPDSINYKKGDVFGGIAVSLSNDKKQVVSNLGNYSVQIPVENFTILNDDGTPFDTRVLDVKNSTQQMSLQKIENTNMTAEDKLYEKLGIKRNTSGWGLKSRPMGRLLLLLVAVGGYLAYKKFKK